MSKIFATIGNFFSRLRGQPAVDKLEVPSYVAAIQDTLGMLQDSLKPGSPGRIAISTVLASGDTKNPIVAKVRDAYRKALKGQSSTVLGMEHHDYFSAFYQTIIVTAADLDKINSLFSSVFGESEAPSVQSSEMRMSTAIVLGYVEYAYTLATWVSNFAAAAMSLGDPSGSRGVEPYVLTHLADHADTVNALMGEVLNRRGASDIVSLVSGMESRGRNLMLEVGERHIGQYAQEKDFTKAELGMAESFMRSPMLMIGTAIVERKRLRYERLKSLQTFFRGKVALETLRLANKSPDDADYAKLQDTVANYSRMLADNQEKLDRIEKHV